MAPVAAKISMVKMKPQVALFHIYRVSQSASITMADVLVEFLVSTHREAEPVAIALLVLKPLPMLAASV
jgi:hypothetical protein